MIATTISNKCEEMLWYDSPGHWVVWRVDDEENPRPKQVYSSDEESSYIYPEEQSDVDNVKIAQLGKASKRIRAESRGLNIRTDQHLSLDLIESIPQIAGC